MSPQNLKICLKNKELDGDLHKYMLMIGFNGK